MDSVEMKDLFLETVARAKKKYSFRIDNFCVLGNHFHMIIQPLNGASLSAIMQWIMSVFAMRWNRIHLITGHVWGNRFFSRPITTLPEFLKVFQYIDENPIKAGQVDRTIDWKHSGLCHFQRGLRHIVDNLPVWLITFFPGHCQLALV